jgi:hypothetical protein
MFSARMDSVLLGGEVNMNSNEFGSDNNIAFRRENDPLSTYTTNITSFTENGDTFHLAAVGLFEIPNISGKQLKVSAFP